MVTSESILNLKTGALITVTTRSLEQVTLSLKIGDALLNGDRDQVWLENREYRKLRYLRRMPEANMSIGSALFSSLTELARTLESGDYYIA